MGDDKDGTPFHQAVHALLDQPLGAGINAAGGFVQDHHRWIGYSAARDGDQLALSLGQFAFGAGDLCLISLRQPADESMGVGQLRRFDHFLVGGIRPAVADIVQDASGEKAGILQDHAQRAPQIRFSDVLDRDAVIQNLSFLHVVKAIF